jgi:hypothetical protein
MRSLPDDPNGTAHLEDPASLGQPAGDAFQGDCAAVTICSHFEVVRHSDQAGVLRYATTSNACEYKPSVACGEYPGLNLIQCVSAGYFRWCMQILTQAAEH